MLVAPLWFLMVFLPGWRWTERVLRSPWVAAPAALLYAALVAPRLGAVLSVVANPDLEGVSTLLSTPVGVTIAWVHFLAFDLFVGRWIHLDSRKRGLSPWLSGPLLLVTLLLGPLGFFLYLLVHQSRQNR